MSNSTPTFDAITQAQAGKEITANAMLDATSPASLFGRRQSTSSGTSWGYYGGNVLIGGVLTQIANGTLSLTINTTNYVEATRAGVVSRNTTGFTAGQIPLYSIVVGPTTVTSWFDWRMTAPPSGLLAKAMTDANTTLTAGESLHQILQFTGTLTVARNIVLPLAAQQWTVFNNTAGGFGLQFIGASGTGITVAATKRAIIHSDGTNVVRVSADV